MSVDTKVREQIMQETKDIGLRGITVADTRICAIDGEKGKLIYRGYDIEELAHNSTFEERGKSQLVPWTSFNQSYLCLQILMKRQPGILIFA
jgi:hypothetical protein